MQWKEKEPICFGNAAYHSPLLVIDDTRQRIKGSETSYNKETCTDVLNTKFPAFICIENSFLLNHSLAFPYIRNYWFKRYHSSISII